jgi:hypothetical protein
MSDAAAEFREHVDRHLGGADPSTAGASSPVPLPNVGLRDAWTFCHTEQGTAQKLREQYPDSAMYAQRVAAFAALKRLIENCAASEIIKAELRKRHDARAEAERAAIAEAAQMGVPMGSPA